MMPAYRNFIQRDNESAKRKIEEYLKKPPVEKPVQSGETVKAYEFSQLVIDEQSRPQMR